MISKYWQYVLSFRHKARVSLKFANFLFKQKLTNDCNKMQMKCNKLVSRPIIVHVFSDKGHHYSQYVVNAVKFCLIIQPF